MNIFFTDKCPAQCAKNLDTKRVIKMNLETAQMLSTALYIKAPQIFTVVEFTDLSKMKVRKAYYIDGIRVCAPTHKNHPSNVWLRETRSNYLWGLNHFDALAKVYNSRRGKWHKTYRETFNVLKKYSHLIPDGKLTSFVNCAANESKGVNFKHMSDTIQAYQLYLNRRWETDVREPTWD